MPDVDVETFQKKIVVRAIRMEDYDKIVALQLKCFPGMKPWTTEQFESQLSIFADGQICVEYHGKIVASSSSLILDFALYGEYHNWKDVSNSGYITNHNTEGNTLYGIEIMVDPEYRGMKLARRLYDARKKIAVERNLMRIVLGGRIPGYGKYAKEMTAREYVDKVIQKVLIDPVLTTQLANGFVLKRLIGSYMESDKESKGYATLLEWTNLDFSPNPDRVFLAAQPVRICVVQYEMRKINSFEDFVRQCEF
ncbi:MAG: GNAT family N-acetyltransferase, partial [Ignavibacteria bacterium]|nr:GNAT family N-acetyltransferase [Ignavibacteria bacterium]